MLAQNARQPSISSLNPTPAGGGIHKNWVPNLQDVYRKEKAKKSANKTFTKRKEFGELHSQRKMALGGALAAISALHDNSWAKSSAGLNPYTSSACS